MDSTELRLALARAQQDPSGSARALNALGSGYQQRGELEEAAQIFAQALQHAEQAGDTRLVATIEQNLGIIANIQGNIPAALGHFNASLAAIRMTGQQEHEALVLNNLGTLYTDLQWWSEAEQAFQAALESTTRSGSTAAQLTVEVNRTKLAIVQENYGRAKSLCDHAFKLATQTNDLRALGELHKHYGMIFRETNQLPVAEKHLARAMELACARDDLLLAAETAREEAFLYWRQERNPETLRSLNLAHQLFSRLRAQREIADVDRRIAQLEAKFLELVKRWGASIESADQYTQGHSVRVAGYAYALARTLGFDEKTLFWFRLGALLHDVGKIIVPVEVLKKPGQLTDEERAIIERHPDAGVALLGDIEFPWDVRPMVRHHHERWEGGGYPAGIAGEEIPLSARILCIADVYDALTSDRPYRVGFSQERALDIMTSSMASHFDPELLHRWMDLCYAGEVRELAKTLAEDALAQLGQPARTVEEEEESTDLSKILVVARDFRDPSLLRMAAPPDGAAPIEVIHVGRVSDAAHRLREESFDAIVLGLPLQEGQELEALTYVHEQAPEVPVLVIASTVDDWLLRNAIRNGAQDVLVRGELTGSMLLRSIRTAIERNRLQLDLRAKSLLDDLTGLYNRRGFSAVAAQQLRRAERKKERIAIIYADVNEFKQINDRFGHSEGDLALVDVSNLLKSTFRQSDTLGRIGGDEFVALLPDAGPGAVATLTERLTKHLEVYNAYAGRRYQLSISVGSAIYNPHTPITIDELLRKADEAMYQQKQGESQGRGRGHAGLEAVVA